MNRDPASRPPPVLQRIRVARRDAAAAELRRLQELCNSAQASQQQAIAGLQSACNLRVELRSGRGPAASGHLRMAALPSCEAWVSRAEEQLAQANHQLEKAQAALAPQRQALQDCERALLRSQAWAQQLRQAQQAHELQVEQDLDDELAARFRSAANTSNASIASNTELA